MAPVDEDGKLDSAGAAVVVHRIEGGPGGSSGEEDVVDEDDRLSGDVTGHPGGMHLQGSARVQVVAMHRDVEHSAGHFEPPNPGEEPGEALGEVDAAGLDTDQDHPRPIRIPFGNLVCHPREGTLQGAGIKKQSAHAIGQIQTDRGAMDKARCRRGAVEGLGAPSELRPGRRRDPMAAVLCRGSAYSSPDPPWRPRRQPARCLEIQSVRAASKPMS